MADFEVVVGAGTLQTTAVEAVRFPHPWTDGGVTVEAASTGAHLLHLPAVGCVLNDVYREAERPGLPVDGVRVTATGGFDPTTWRSTGIDYVVRVDSPAGAGDVEVLLRTVDDVAEIPKTIRAGGPVRRVER